MLNISPLKRSFVKLACIAFGSLLVHQQANAQCSTTYGPYQDCSWGDAIDAFSLAGVASTGNYSCANYYGYILYNTPVRNLSIGQTYNWTATAGTSGSSTYYEGMAIWIDLNGNGQFESSEMLANSGAANSHSGTITIPTTATAGNNRRMRVRCAYSGSSNTILFSGSDACTDYMGLGYGETEDYLVNLCPAASVTRHPIAANACVGSAAQFSVLATNAGSYKWQVNTGSGFTDITNNTVYSGANTATLSLTGIPANYNQYQYRCVVVSSCGGNINSNAATLTIIDATTINAQSVSGNYCHGVATALFVTTAGGDATGFEWQVDRGTGFVPLQNGEPYFGVDNDTLSILPLGDTMNGFVVRCIVTGACTNDTSDNITLNVEAVPSITADPVDVTVREFSEAVFSVTAKGNATYRWQASAVGTNNYVNINDGNHYENTLTPQLTVKNASIAQTGYQFRCLIAGIGNCGVTGDTSESAVLTVERTTSIQDKQNITAISLYPNPATGSDVAITLNNNYPGNNLDVTIADKSGRLVYTGTVALANGKTGNLHIGKLAPGIYTVTLSNKEANLTETIKLIKQ